MTVSSTRLRRPLKAARWLAGAGVVWLIAVRLNPSELHDVVNQTRFGWIIAAAGLEFARIMSGAASMRLMLGAFGKPFAYADVLRVNMRAAFFGVAADWIGAAVRWGGMMTHLGVKSSTAAAVMLWEAGLVWSVAYGLNWILLPVAARSVWSGTETRVYLIFLLCAGPVLAVLGVLWIWWVNHPQKMTETVSRWLPDIAGLRTRIRSLANGSDAKPSLTAERIFKTGALILVQFLFSSVILYCFARAVGAPLDGATALWICAFVVLTQSLPAALLGWTFRVGLLAFLLPRLGGGTAEQAVVIGICGGLVSLMGALGGGADFFFHCFGRKKIKKDVAS